ncbi:MAG TPA: hypothetical protein VFA21_15800 [Pyrinomonadaceae bacterium]|nr:hypothetical protein [Pyrinomonadaceae bacterium]
MSSSKHSTRPALARLYAVAGRSICVECAAEESARIFRRYFAGWHVSPLEDACGASPDATIKVRDGEKSPHAPAGFESFEVAEGGVCRTDGRTYFFESEGSAVVVRGETPTRVEVWFGDTPRARENAARARVIFNASMTAMRRCGLFELHAAGVVSSAGAGALFVGPSGSGKSTLTTQLAAAGWRYLSDDTLLIFDGGGSVEARALRRVFAVTEPTVASGILGGYESLLADPVPFDVRKLRFEPQSVFPGGFVEACAPRVLFFTAVTNERESRTRKLSQAETMRRLIRMCPWACYDKPPANRHLGLLAQLSRQAAGFELLAGLDLFGDAARASRYVEKLLEGA